MQYEGYEVPEILKPDELVVCDEDFDLEDEGIVSCDGFECADCVFCEENMQTAEEFIVLYKSNPKIIIAAKENNMNTNISNVFDKAKEALLVEKHLGNQIGTSFIDGLVLADKKEDVLKEAKRLEKEEGDK